MKRTYFGLKPMDIVIIIWSAWTMWKALHLEPDEPARAIFWVLLVFMVLWLTDPWRKK